MKGLLDIHWESYHPGLPVPVFRGRICHVLVPEYLFPNGLALLVHQNSVLVSSFGICTLLTCATPTPIAHHLCESGWSHSH